MPARYSQYSKILSVLLILQMVFLPWIASAQSNDPIGPGGFIGPPQKSGEASNQPAQTTGSGKVWVCVAVDLVENESWGHPYPGSEMDQFKSYIRNYLQEHGDPRLQYRIRDQAFEMFTSARNLPSPYTPVPPRLLEQVPAEQGCPAAYHPYILEALPVCETAAKSSPPRPRYQYLYGQVLDAAHRNAEAAKWYQKAGEAGYFDAYANLGALSARSNPPNYAEAFTLAQKAAQGGSVLGCMQLGWYYQNGIGVNQIPELARRWYEETAKKGLAEAMYLLGLMYQKGVGIQRDDQAAANWFYEAAKQGHAWAQAELGYMFYNGLGTKQDDQAAFTWFLQAAQAGIVVAQNSVAIMYSLGEGVLQNDSEAVAWYRKAAEQNNLFAVAQLGSHLGKARAFIGMKRKPCSGSGKRLRKDLPLRSPSWAMDT